MVLYQNAPQQKKIVKMLELVGIFHAMYTKLIFKFSDQLASPRAFVDKSELAQYLLSSCLRLEEMLSFQKVIFLTRDM